MLGTRRASASRIAVRLASNPSNRMLWGVLGGLREHRELPQAQAMLQQLANSGTDVASAAREELR
jgi:hypothetical protein